MNLRCEYIPKDRERCNLLAEQILTSRNLYVRLCPEHLEVAQVEYAGKDKQQAVMSMNQDLSYWLMRKQGFDFDNARQRFSELVDEPVSSGEDRPLEDH